MSESKEFLGKTLDAAIAEACAHFDVPREKLEIDIIEDAKTGIFGIVGARKAKIVARLATLPIFMPIPSAPKPEKEGRRRGRNDRRRERAEQEAASVAEDLQEPSKDIAEELLTETEANVSPAKAPVESVVDNASPVKDEQKSEEIEAKPEQDENEAPRSRRGRQGRQNGRQNNRGESAPRAEKQEKADRADDGDAMESSLPRVPLNELDQEKLTDAARTVVGKLVAPILDKEPEDVELSLEIGEDRIQISVKSEDTGLLIGRDGQNLAAVQYLASRMITRIMGSQIRVQVDAGDYHVRQDSRLQELAFSLAEKVKATGKVQTTRPLSAYQRRVIHLALQNDPDVQTRSSGEGALKHVVILKRKD
ncbi:MAG: Jag N-terminal domain-containing protein [Mailhella sp.]|nr:Jag N-terminal domain-containing protein [Mailhella sp.]